MDQRESLIGRDYFVFIKGVAIILMIIHHSFGFPNYYIVGIRYANLEGIAGFIRAVTKICVPIFVFLTGQGYYLHKDFSLSHSVKKVTQSLISYWIVFFY